MVEGFARLIKAPETPETSLTKKKKKKKKSRKVLKRGKREEEHSVLSSSKGRTSNSRAGVNYKKDNKMELMSRVNI